MEGVGEKPVPVSLCPAQIKNELTSCHGENPMTNRLSHDASKTIIFLVVLYRCGSWSLMLRKEYRLRVFDNRALRTPGRKT
jgi:hypothetical protein